MIAAIGLGWIAVRGKNVPWGVPLASLEPGELCLVTPGKDTRSQLVADIDQARKSVLVECYLISDPAVVASLKDAKTRGCDVHVIMEESPYGGFSMNRTVRNELRSAGIDAIWGNRVYSFTHAKFIVIDACMAWIMTANLTKSAFEKNREILVRTGNTAVVGELTRIFQADKQRSPYRAKTLVVSPVNGRQEIGDVLGGARSTIDVATEVFDDPGIRRILEDRARHGVAVRVLTASADKIPANRVTRSLLQGTRIQMQYLGTPYLHAKYMIIDHRIAYIGSHNLSAGSLDENRETGVLTEDRLVLGVLDKTFAADWGSGE